MEKLVLESLAKKAGAQADGRKEGPPVLSKNVVPAAAWGEQCLTPAWVEELGKLACHAGESSVLAKLTLETQVVQAWHQQGVAVSMFAAAQGLADQEGQEFFFKLGADATVWKHYWQLPVVTLAIRVKAGACPAALLCLSDLISSTCSGPAFLLHLDVRVAAQAKVTILDDLNQQLALAGGTCHIFRALSVSEQATVTYALLTNGLPASPAPTIYQRFHAVLAEKADLRFLEASLAASLTSVVESVVTGRGVTSHLNLAVLSGQQGESRFNYRHRHLVGGSTAEINMRAVARGSAVITLPGLVQIAKGAQDTVSNLYQAVLALGEKASIKPVPQLEICANEVQATHSSTVSQINQDDYFYAASRGIDVATAERLIVRGFLCGVMTDTVDAVTPGKILTALDACL